MKFSPDGRWIVSASDDNTVKVRCLLKCLKVLRVNDLVKVFSCIDENSFRVQPVIYRSVLTGKAIFPRRLV